MHRSLIAAVSLGFVGALFSGGPPGPVAVVTAQAQAQTQTQAEPPTADHASLDPLARLGRAIFRYDTFGDEQLWTGFLRMPEALATVDPKTALASDLQAKLPES